MEFHTLPQDLYPVILPFTFIMGLAMGSFANVLIYRLPRNMSIIKPSSHCPHCKKSISPLENIPLISYIFLKGKCRSCGARISLQYPIVELMMGILFTAVMIKCGFNWLFLFYSGFCFILVVHAFIDYQHFLLLDVLNIAGAVLGLLCLILVPDLSLKNGLFGALAGGGALLLIYIFTRLVFKREGMGIGDIKTAAVYGLFLGPIHTGFMLLAASLIGVIWGIIRLIAKGEKMLPFGTLMAVSSIVTLFWGGDIIGWYFNLIP
ncbi:prepilin peptidase [bacterium]|nr:prepilin peptidase [FCB group bacterium]MBL7191992.1 prepilin peptidase [bacterium]